MLALDDLTPDAQSTLRSDLRIALIGGVVASALMGGIALAAGNLSGHEARDLLRDTMPTTRFLCSGVMTASATTLALMLTLLGMSDSKDHKVRGGHYERIRQIALVDVVAFVLATVLLVSHVTPVGESSAIPVAWYDAIYYTAAVSTSVLGGLLVAIMLLIYTAVRDIIITMGPGDDAPLLTDDAQAEAERAQAEADQAEAEADQAEAKADRARDQADDAEADAQKAER